MAPESSSDGRVEACLAGLEIVQARTEDLPAIVALSQEAFPRDGWSPASLAAELSLDFSHCLVAQSDGVLGYLVYWRILDEVQILQVVTAQRLRRRGVGAALVRRCLEDGRAAGGRSFLLEVRVSNHAARRLYQRIGFTEMALRRRYYHDPVEDAVVMSFHGGLQQGDRVHNSLAPTRGA